MEFAYIVMVILSLVVLGVLFVQVTKRLYVAGTKAFVAQIVLVYIWSVGALMELWTNDMQQMLFWRKFQQIGMYFMPVTCVYFAAYYGRFERWKRYLPLFWVVPVAALVLIFTDDSHHLMYSGFSLSEKMFFGKALALQSTTLGKLFIFYNYTLVALSLVMFGIFAAKVSSRSRKQALLIMLSIFLVFLFAILKTALLEKTGINVPIASLYLPSSLLLFFTLLRHKLFVVSPIAREKVFDVLDQGIIVTDDHNMIVDRNPFAAHLMGVFFGIGQEISGRNTGDVFSSFPQWIEMLTRGEAGQMELQSPVVDGENAKFIRIKVYPMISERGRAIGSVSLLRDITERRMQERRLRSMADQDSLTGLLNRNGFMQALQDELVQAEQCAEPVSVLMIDLDQLKLLNDTYGHFSGDKALLAVADALRRTLRQQDAIGRIGGDEFAVVLPGLGGQEAAAVADRLRHEVSTGDVEMESGETQHITVSIGVCDNSLSDAGAEKIVKLADKAMYVAKRLSRNCCVTWDAAMIENPQTAEELSLHDDPQQPGQINQLVTGHHSAAQIRKVGLDSANG